MNTKRANRPVHIREALQNTFLEIGRNVMRNSDRSAYRKWRREMQIMFGDDVFKKDQEAAA